jgi:hypothetical protein
VEQAHLTERIRIAATRGRYACHRIQALLRREGHAGECEAVYRLYRPLKH